MNADCTCVHDDGDDAGCPSHGIATVRTFVTRCEECGAVEPAPLDAAIGDAGPDSCALCGELMTVEAS